MCDWDGSAGTSGESSETKGKEIQKPSCVCISVRVTCTVETENRLLCFSASFSVLFRNPLFVNWWNCCFQSLIGLWPDKTVLPKQKLLLSKQTTKTANEVKFKFKCDLEQIIKKILWPTMSVGLDMWRFSDDLSTARRFNAVAARMQPHCPVLYSGKVIWWQIYRENPFHWYGLKTHGSENIFLSFTLRCCLHVRNSHLGISHKTWPLCTVNCNTSTGIFGEKHYVKWILISFDDVWLNKKERFVLGLKIEF